MGGHPTSPSLYCWCQATPRAHSWKREKQEPAAPPARTGRAAQPTAVPAPANAGTERHQRGWAGTPFGFRVNTRYESIPPAPPGQSLLRDRPRRGAPAPENAHRTGSGTPGGGSGQWVAEQGRHSQRARRPPPSRGAASSRSPTLRPSRVPGGGHRAPAAPFMGRSHPPRHAPAVQHGGPLRCSAPAHCAAPGACRTAWRRLAHALHREPRSRGAAGMEGSVTAPAALGAQNSPARLSPLLPPCCFQSYGKLLGCGLNALVGNTEHRCQR